MKHHTPHLSAFLLLFLALIISSESTGEDVKISEIKSTRAGTTVVEEDSSFNKLMGLELESCEDGDDEECLQRRLISEAHLDYIYTQQQRH